MHGGIINSQRLVDIVNTKFLLKYVLREFHSDADYLTKSGVNRPLRVDFRAKNWAYEEGCPSP